MALCMIYFHCLSAMAFLVQIFLVIVIRYFSIFHSHVIMEMDETKLIKKSRGFIVLASTAALIVEVFSDANFGRGPLYKMLVSGEYDASLADKPMKLYPFRSVVLIDIILMIILEMRVEHDNYQMSRNQCHQQSEEHCVTIHTAIYDKLTVRTVLCLIGAALMTVLLSPFTFSDENSHKIRTLGVAAMIVNVIPMIFIYRNENMTKFLLSKCALWITTTVLAPDRIRDIV